MLKKNGAYVVKLPSSNAHGINLYNGRIKLKDNQQVCSITSFIRLCTVICTLYAKYAYIQCLAAKPIHCHFTKCTIKILYN